MNPFKIPAMVKIERNLEPLFLGENVLGIKLILSTLYIFLNQAVSKTGCFVKWDMLLSQWGLESAKCLLQR